MPISRIKNFIRNFLLLSVCLIVLRKFLMAENFGHKNSLEILGPIEKILDDSPPVIDRPKKKILIITEARSGSSFFGDLMQHLVDQSYYAFEPLLQVKLPNFSIIPDIFRCRFDKSFYLNNKYYRIFYMNSNALLRKLSVILEDRNSLFNETIHEKICRQSSLILVKTIRFNLNDFRSVINHIPSANDIKVIFLVRDPRAVLSSRFKLNWCIRSPNCTSNIVLCQRMRSNLRMLKSLADSLVLLRYEDLVGNVSDTAHRIARHFGIKITEPLLNRWIRTHTGTNDSHPQSTFRNLSANHLTRQWLTDLSRKEIADIESTCADVMDQLGYVQISSIITTVTETNSNNNDSYEFSITTEFESDFQLFKHDYPLKKFSIVK